MKLKHKISIGIIGLLCLIGLTFFFFVNYQVTQLVNYNLTNELSSILTLGYDLLDEVYPGPWRRDNGNLYKGEQLINDRYQVVDLIRNHTNALATVFLDDTRIATNVTLENGARAVGTKAAPEVVETVLINGRDFTGEADVAGRPFLTRYTPLRDSSGKVIGMWFVGVEKKQARNLVNRISLSLGLILLVGIVLGTVAAFIFTGLVLKPIPLLLSAFQRAAAGDLTAKLPALSDDEIGQLATGFNQLLKQQAETSVLIQSIAEKVSDSSLQIAAGNEDLSQRTQEEAAALEELSATMQEMGASIQQVSSNAQQANHFSQTTLDVVKEGEEAIVNTISAMEQISASSNQITAIIQVVNDISFQTNLLALNAAVEAARAGEHGRGFAVVAAEVRSLAGRASEAAQEIEALITESVSRVENGNEMVRKSGEILNQIVENTMQTSAAITAVADAIREQTSAIQQIQSSIDQLNHVTQDNAAMVEELASSCQFLKNEAEKLSDMLNQFKVG
ncbi:MAG: HAMP domain-containing protein [Firmicutes bacterium]|nr:HAMP domain-containing protein [Bacillota bacterium]